MFVVFVGGCGGVVDVRLSLLLLVSFAVVVAVIVVVCCLILALHSTCVRCVAAVVLDQRATVADLKKAVQAQFARTEIPNAKRISW